MVALVLPAVRATVNCLLIWEPVSATILTVAVAVVAFAAKLTVVLARVKSVPCTAVPSVAAMVAVTGEVPPLRTN